ncbi:MAG: hypothetical protein N2Z21_01170, partial [Candidatus Sumerlaeaceae bacterium]|nr:hypothetical protein [Candidatus Sumerlaeaceae bacterium]
PYTYRIESTAPRRLAAFLAELPTVESLVLDGDGRSLLVRTGDAVELCRFVQEVACGGDIKVMAIAPTDESLEAVFQYLVKD